MARHLKENLEKFSKNGSLDAKDLRNRLESCVVAIKKLRELQKSLLKEQESLQFRVKSSFEAAAAEILACRILQEEKNQLFLEKQGIFQEILRNFLIFQLFCEKLRKPALLSWKSRKSLQNRVSSFPQRNCSFLRRKYVIIAVFLRKSEAKVCKSCRKSCF